LQIENIQYSVIWENIEAIIPANYQFVLRNR